MDKYILAIDQGTTSTRCMVFDKKANVITSDQMEHRQIYPQPGWVAHSPVEIWDRTRSVIRNCLASIEGGSEAIAAIGITNQRETTVLWDKETGIPLPHAIVWQDTRTEQICKALEKDKGQDFFRSKTGLPISTYFSAPKIKWVFDFMSNSCTHIP